MWCKHCNFESSLHVPLMIKVPGKTKGQRTADITEYVDIYPSLSELAGLPIPDELEGESFVGSINGEKRVDDFAISKYHDGVTIVKGDYFYTEYLGDNDEAVARMLFNHTTDPLELKNLSEEKEFEAVIQELHTMLRSNWGDEFFVNKKVELNN
jgi:iduronate 2-sulfatase